MLYWSILSSQSSADKVILASSPSQPITSILASPEAATRLRVLESKVNSDSPVIAAAPVAVAVSAESEGGGGGAAQFRRRGGRRR